MLQQVKVYHNPAFYEFFLSDKTEKLRTETLQLVAIVLVEDEGQDEIDLLETAYQSTNHIDRPWYDNPNVKVIIKSRSTSMGDVLELDGRFFVVDRVGFRELETQPVAS